MQVERRAWLCGWMQAARVVVDKRGRRRANQPPRLQQMALAFDPLVRTKETKYRY